MTDIKIILILPYFGIFPNYFQLYLNSIEKNPEFDWLVITDDRTKYRYPKNVKIVNMSFEDIRERFNERLGMQTALHKPYKLCDFRPAYGYLFSEFIKGYDFWGYCDADVIYGKLADFVSDEMLNYSKIFEWGHFTLIRNDEECIRMFLQKTDGTEYYKEVFLDEKNLNFDEIMINPKNINAVFEQNGHKVFKESYAADIYTKSSMFKVTKGFDAEKRKESFFLWDNGRLIRYVKCKGRIETEEYMYIHLQKRRMAVHTDPVKSLVYKIIPNEFAPLEVSRTEVESKFDMIKKYNPNLHYFNLRWNNLRIKVSNCIKDIRGGRDG